MCGCTNKTKSRTITSTTRTLSNNVTNRSLNMSKVATPEILESLYKEYPNEFVLADYNNGSNFRYAKSVNGGLIKYGYDYYGVFSGVQTIYVHKSDVNNNIVKLVQIEREIVKDKIIEILEAENVEEVVENINEVEEILEVKPKRKRSKKSETENVEE